MKKIDTWLGVQQFVLEASVAIAKIEHSEVQFISRPSRFHARRLIKINHHTV